MSDWTPQVVMIDKIQPLPNSDKLDLVTVMTDYPVVTKRGDYKEGDLVGYIPIDTIVPDTLDYYFLCPLNDQKIPKYPVGLVPEKYRCIKAKKIRGTYSQGLLIKPPVGLSVGDSIVDVCHLKKWEEEEEDNIPLVKKKTGTNAEKKPKGWDIPYYDIDSIRKYVESIIPGEYIVLTEKIHGSNFSARHDGNRLWVKSRNFFKNDIEGDMWRDAARSIDLENKLIKYPQYVFFGEVYGNVKNFPYDTQIVEKEHPVMRWWERCVLYIISSTKTQHYFPEFSPKLYRKSTNNGKYRIRECKVRFFDIWDLKTKRFIDYDDFIKIIDELELERVPELYRGPWLDKDTMYDFAEGKSMLADHIREGFVLRTIVERYDEKRNGRMQVKLVGKGYNLAK